MDDVATSKKDDLLLKLAKKRFRLCVDSESKSRDGELDDISFVSPAGDQWPGGIRKARENDRSGARPCLTVNKLTQYTRQVINEQRKNRPSIKVRPVDDFSDPKTAQIMQGLVRHIEDSSKADLAYDVGFQWAVNSGLGYFRVMSDYSSHDSFDQEIKITSLHNRFACYADPDFKEVDGCDMKYFFIVEELDEDEYKEKYPNAEPINWEEAKGDNSVWIFDKKVRVAEYYYIEEEVKKLLRLESGKTIFEDEAEDNLGDAVVDERDTVVSSVKWCKITPHEILDRKQIPGKYIPVIPVIGNCDTIDGERIFYGLVRPAKDPQRIYNFTRTAEVEISALSPKAPYIAAEGQIEGHEEEWATANNANRPVLTYKPTSISGQLVPAPQRNQYPGSLTGLSGSTQTAEHDIQTTMGMYDASLGERSNERSGVAIRARQQEGDTATFHYADNFSRSIRHAGRIIVDWIPVIYDTRRVIRVLGEENELQSVTINPQQQESVDYTGKVFNLGVGKFDVTTSSGPSYSTKRQEAVDAMLQLTQANPDLVTLIGDLMVRNMDWPGADQIADRLKKMLPPQLQEENQPIPPEIEQQMQQMQEQMQQLGQENQQLKSKEQESMAALSIKKVGVDAETSIKAEQVQNDFAIEKERLRLAREKAEAELELQRDKAMAEIALKREIEMMDKDVESARDIVSSSGSMEKTIQQMAQAIHEAMMRQGQSISELADISKRRRKITYDENGEPNGTEIEGMQ